jgi:hypothetical protein
MRESNGTRNPSHRQIVVHQQLFRALDFTLDDIAAISAIKAL